MQIVLDNLKQDLNLQLFQWKIFYIKTLFFNLDWSEITGILSKFSPKLTEILVKCWVKCLSVTNETTFFYRLVFIIRSVFKVKSKPKTQQPISVIFFGRLHYITLEFPDYLNWIFNR